ncbi:MAG: PadR family transcriptional regulator [Verrucomicrobia bacterium]|nr:PadR family transcriptional regulator [Verrucomicrobiota bacterium]
MPKTELLQGTLDMLILRVLSAGSQHGWGIAQRIAVLSQDALRVEEGSLYPCLYRMEQKGWIDSEWGQSENNRRAKFYTLTKAGRKQLESERENWAVLCTAIGQVMGPP